MTSILAICFALRLGAAIDCPCDPSKPDTMAVRQCGLCREAEARPASQEILFLKDINPRKPNRLLVLPRLHGKANHSFGGLPAGVRTRLWTEAIEKAKALHGDRWGIAMNGDEVRTQCHTHLHIGKLIEGVETEWFVEVDGPENIPVPDDGSGLWIHAAGGKLHVHVGEQIAETVLLR